LSRKPKLVLECDNGASTAVIALALKHIGSRRAIALEHQDWACTITKPFLAEWDALDYAELRCAPLTGYLLRGEPHQWCAWATLP